MSEKMLKAAAERYRDSILPPYDKIMELENGFEAICAFSKAFSGGSVYVPSLRTIFKECIDQEIQEQHNGKNIRELVRAYGFSERYIRNLLR